MSEKNSGLKKLTSTAVMLPGGALLVLGLALASVVIAEMARGKVTPGSYGALIFFLGLGVLGGWMTRRGLRGIKEAEAGSARSAEVALLRALASRGGRATSVELCVLLDLRPSEAEALADQLARQGQLEVLVSPGGVVVYEARGLLSDHEKSQATAFPAVRVASTNTDSPARPEDPSAHDDEALGQALDAQEAARRQGGQQR
jgi:hypothetical protein